MNLSKKIFVPLLLFALFLLPVAPALAATISQLSVENKGDFVLEPGKIEVYLNPGESVNRSISVINRMNKKVNFKVEVEDFIGSDNPNTPVILLGDEKSPYSFKENLVPELNKFSLGFGEKIELPVSIRVPENAAPGGFYSSVIISSEPEPGAADSQGGAKIVSRVGVLFFVRVNGPVELKGKLEDFRLSGGKSYMQKGPVDFEILFKNEGNIHLVPYGKIVIKNLIGHEIGSVPVDAYFALPRSMRYRQVSFQKTNLFGRYTAELTLNKGFDGAVDVQKLSFWIVPWRTLASIIAVLIVLAYLWRFVSTRFEFRRKVD